MRAVLELVKDTGPIVSRDEMDETQGHNLWALARALDMVQTCPQCLCGVLCGVSWLDSAPDTQTFSCGHSGPAQRQGRHRKP